MSAALDAVLDPTTMQQLQDLGGDSEPGLFDELLGLYMTDARRRIRELQEARDRRDWPILEYAAHALKSGSLNIGANSVAELCHHLELAVREGRETVVKNVIGRIAEEFQLVEQAVSANALSLVAPA